MLRESRSLPVDPGYISVPKEISWPTENGDTSHGYYYPPQVNEFCLRLLEKSSQKFYIGQTRTWNQMVRQQYYVIDLILYVMLAITGVFREETLEPLTRPPTRTFLPARYQPGYITNSDGQ